MRPERSWFYMEPESFFQAGFNRGLDPDIVDFIAEEEVPRFDVVDFRVGFAAAKARLALPDHYLV